MSLERDAYMAALRAVQARTTNIDKMYAACPHLTRPQVEKLWNSANAYVALPPVLIKNSSKTGYCGYFGQGFQLNNVHNRTLASYADGRKRGDIFGDYAYAEEAMTYADKHWPHNLCLDSWVDAVELILLDPIRLDHRMPRAVISITVGLSRGINDLHNDHSRGRAETWNDAIAIATLNPYEGNEIRGGRGVPAYQLCARCGGGLGKTACRDCGARYEFLAFSGSNPTPLPAKLVKLVADTGHKFALDPARLY